MSGPSTAALFEQVEALRKRVTELERVTGIAPVPPTRGPIGRVYANEAPDGLGRRDVLGAQHAGQ